MSIQECERCSFLQMDQQEPRCLRCEVARLRGWLRVINAICLEATDARDMHDGVRGAVAEAIGGEEPCA